MSNSRLAENDQQMPKAKHNKYSKSKKQSNQLNSDQDSNDQQKNKDNKQQQQQQQPGYDQRNNQSQNLNAEIQFGDSQLHMKCPFCLQSIRTQIILKPELISILLGFALFISFPHLITLFITIIVLQITATRKHRCPLCQRQLGSDGKFLIFFKDEMYSFTFGNLLKVILLGTNGIIISKKILSSIGIAVGIFVILSFKVSDAYADVEWTSLKWVQFQKQCPWEDTSIKCQNQYQGQTVKNWKGFVMRVQDNRNSLKRHFQHAVSIFIKMNQPTTLRINTQKPDLFLTISAYQAHQWQQRLDNLSHGDQIIFNGTFTYLRNNRGVPIGRHMNLIDMNKTQINNKDIHLYMSTDEDLWFFENLSGEKLRRHEQMESSGNVQSEIKQQLGKILGQIQNEQKIRNADQSSRNMGNVEQKK